MKENKEKNASGKWGLRKNTDERFVPNVYESKEGEGEGEECVY